MSCHHEIASSGGGGQWSPPRPRLILLDDNLRDLGGHYYELATLLLAGAQELGYQCVLATHAGFDQPGVIDPRWQLHPTFATRRLVRWSLGADGDSQYQRDLDGKSIGGSRLQNAWAALADNFTAPRKRPRRMLEQWRDDLCRLLGQLQPTSTDTLLVNTGDDFAMLALAAALQRVSLPPLRIDVIFHFALYDPAQPDRAARLQQWGRQIRAALAALHPHRVHLHATTDSLAAQLREAQCGCEIRSIPYPTRPRGVVSTMAAPPWKVVLAGLPRAEKGRAAIADLLRGLEHALRQGQLQVSMQMPARRWKSMVPRSLHGSYRRSLNGDTHGPLSVMVANLSTEAYHRWLDTADAGLFLYEPDRYVARCSGVLLEMLTRGVPVIVPDGCWLADQVRLAGGHGTIGLIYRNREEIPELIGQYANRQEQIRARSVEYAATIAARHHGRNTLLSMGLEQLPGSGQWLPAAA